MRKLIIKIPVQSFYFTFCILFYSLPFCRMNRGSVVCTAKHSGDFVDKNGEHLTHIDVLLLLQNGRAIEKYR